MDSFFGNACSCVEKFAGHFTMFSNRYPKQLFNVQCYTIKVIFYIIIITDATSQWYSNILTMKVVCVCVCASDTLSAYNLGYLVQSWIEPIIGYGCY